MATFTLDAWIIADRHPHHRVRDHYGLELATNIVLDEAVGGYPARTTVQEVLAGLYARVIALDSFNHHVSTFTLDAAILALGGVSGSGTLTGALALYSVLRGTRSGDFTLDAWLARGGSFTLDAVILVPSPSFTLDAWII